MNATSNVSYLAKSTSATSAAAPSFALALYNWLAMVYSPLTAYYLPVVVAFGLVSNALTLLVMLSSAAVAAQTSRTARVYYIALACADEFVLIAQALVRFLGDGLFVMTNGQKYVYLDQFSDVWCKFWRYLFMAGEGFVNWTLIALNAERIFVINFPFVARRFVTVARVRFELCCLLLVILGVSLVNLDVYKMTAANAVNKVNLQCTAVIQNFNFLSVLEAFTMGFGLVGVPIFLLLILVAVLVSSVHRAQEGKESLKHGSVISKSSIQGEKSESKRSSAEALGAIITISTFAFLLYFPWALDWSVFTSLQPLFSGDLALLLNLLRRFLFEFCIVANSTNFYIYLIHIKVFREEFVRIVLCNVLNLKAGGAARRQSSYST